MTLPVSHDPSQKPVSSTKRSVRAGLCFLIVISGLSLRLFGFGQGFPAFVVKYGGSLLWAAMVFFLVTMVTPKQPRWSVALSSAGIALGVELFRLVHTPWLDAFRLTLPGALILGRIFSPWNLLAYGFGIAFGVWLDRFAGRVSAASAAAPHSPS